MSDPKQDLVEAGQTMDRAARRLAEYRRHPSDRRVLHDSPYKLRGLVGIYAIIARKGAALTSVKLTDWDSWPLVDKDGNLP